MTTTMASSDGMTYESMYRYLRNAEKQITCTLDVNSNTNPFDDPNDYHTISDLQIYCDTLSNQLTHELTQMSPNCHVRHVEDTESSNGSNSGLNGKQSVEWMTESKSQSLASIASQASQSSHSPTLHTNSDSNVNTMSSTSSHLKTHHKTNTYVTNMTNTLDMSYNRLSEYENNDELDTELMTAQQIHQIVCLCHSFVIKLLIILSIYSLHLSINESKL